MSDSNVNVPTQGTVLERSCVLVKLHRHKFNHNATDKELGKRFRKELKVKGLNALRVQKTIIPKTAIAGWNKVLNEAGKYFYGVTIPWDDKAYRLLPVVKYKEFVNKFREFQSRFTSEVDDFIAHLDEHIIAGKKDLGLAANDNDYIDKKAARDEFLLKVEYDVLKSGNDFRAQVTDEERAEIANVMEEQAKVKFAKAQESVFHRVYTVAAKLNEKMLEMPPKGKETPEFRDTIIGNIQDLVDILPSLNVASNPDLDLLKDTLENSLGTLDPQDLRECDRLREDTAKKAKEIMDKAAAFMPSIDA